MSVMPEQGVGSSPQAAANLLAKLEAEQKKLNDQLDDALVEFAVYEEHFNAKLVVATDEERPQLMEERNQVEEAMGIVNIVLRLDELRDLISPLKAKR